MVEMNKNKKETSLIAIKNEKGIRSNESCR